MPARTESHCPSSKSNLTTGNLITERGADDSTFWFNSLLLTGVGVGVGVGVGNEVVVEVEKVSDVDCDDRRARACVKYFHCLFACPYVPSSATNLQQ